MNKYQHWLCVALVLCAACVVNAQQKLVFTPQWTAQSQFVGFYVANSMGYYQEAGLPVSHLLATEALHTLQRRVGDNHQVVLL